MFERWGLKGMKSFRKPSVGGGLGGVNWFFWTKIKEETMSFEKTMLSGILKEAKLP